MRTPSAACVLPTLIGSAAGVLVVLAAGPSLWLPAVALAAGVPAGLAWLDGWRRILVVALVLLLFAESNQPALSSMSFYARYVAMGLLAVWSLNRCGPVRVLAPLQRRFLFGLVAVVVVAALSVLWSVARDVTAQKALALCLLTATLGGLLVGRWRDRDAIAGDLSVIYAVLCSSFAASIVAGLAGMEGSWRHERLSGTFANPNSLGMLCALAIPLGWCLYRSRGRRVYLTGWAVAIPALLLTQCRTAVVAVLAGALWLAARSGMRRLVALTVLIGVGAGLYSRGVVPHLAAIDSLASRFSTVDEMDPLSGRGSVWADAIDAWKHEPLIGYGFAAGPAVAREQYAQGAATAAVYIIHNSYLQWLLEVGLIGAIPMLVLLSSLVTIATRSSIDSMGSGLVWLTVSGLMIQTMESSVFGTGQAYPIVFWSGVAAAIAWTVNGRTAQTPQAADACPGGTSDR